MRHRLIKLAIRLTSVLALAMATVSVASACVVVFYQPEMPADMKSRLRGIRAKG